MPAFLWIALEYSARPAPRGPAFLWRFCGRAQLSQSSCQTESFCLCGPVIFVRPSERRKRGKKPVPGASRPRWSVRERPCANESTASRNTAAPAERRLWAGGDAHGAGGQGRVRPTEGAPGHVGDGPLWAASGPVGPSCAHGRSSGGRGTLEACGGGSVARGRDRSFGRPVGRV